MSDDHHRYHQPISFGYDDPREAGTLYIVLPYSDHDRTAKIVGCSCEYYEYEGSCRHLDERVDNPAFEHDPSFEDVDEHYYP